MIPRRLLPAIALWLLAPAASIAQPATIDFVDVPREHLGFVWIEAAVTAGVADGCATDPPRYCPDAPVTRGQMATFVLRGMHGAGYRPPAATGTRFSDVPASLPLAPWIEELAREGILEPCPAGPSLACPAAPVTRAELAAALVRAKHGAAYEPPAAAGRFADVPASHPQARFVEQLARERVTGGCGPATFCPDVPVTREQVAVLLVRAFALPL